MGDGVERVSREVKVSRWKSCCGVEGEIPGETELDDDDSEWKSSLDIDDETDERDLWL